MKVDRVIFAVNSNPLYSDFWNAFSPVWMNKFKILPTLIFVGSQAEFEKAQLSTQYSEIIRIDPVSDVILNSKDWSVTWAFMWAPVLFPDDVCMTSGIDQLPLSNLFFDLIKDIPDDKYIIGFDGAYRDNLALYPSSHHVGKGSTFQSIYNLSTDWEVEIRKIFALRENYKHLERSHYWGLDEAHSSLVLNNHKHQDQIVKLGMFFQKWAPCRIDRGGHNARYHEGLLREGHYSELHAPRPYHKYRDWINRIIGNIMVDKS